MNEATKEHLGGKPYHYDPEEAAKCEACKEAVALREAARRQLARVQALQLRVLAGLVEETGEPITTGYDASTSGLLWRNIASDISVRVHALEASAR